MKKLLVLGFSAVVVALATGRPADAWINSKFSIGLNWQWQSANNCFLWGVFRNGEIPQGSGAYYMGNPPATVPGEQPFPWFGNTAPQSNIPAVSTGQMPYSNTSYSGSAIDFYTPASYQPNYYYGTGYYNQPYTWYYQR